MEEKQGQPSASPLTPETGIALLLSSATVTHQATEQYTYSEHTADYAGRDSHTPAQAGDQPPSVGEG